MKKSLVLLLISAIICLSFSLQSHEVILPDKKAEIKIDTTGNSPVSAGADKVQLDRHDPSTAKTSGNRNLDILEKLESGNADIVKPVPEAKHYESSIDDQSQRRDNYNSRSRDEYDNYSDNPRRSRFFRGHWAGVEAGFSNYIHVNSMTMPQAIDYMSLDASKSNCFNLNFSQVNIGLGAHAGFVTGLGVNWSNYRFEHPVTISKGEDGIIEELTPGSEIPVKKTKFATLYLNVPLLLEVQIPAGYSHRLNVAGGVVGGLKLNAWTKVVYENGDKNRVNGDYNLNLLRGGVMARVGYENFTIFGTYYLTPWFQELKGPDGFNLEPFEIGLAFTFND